MDRLFGFDVVGGDVGVYGELKYRGSGLYEDWSRVPEVPSGVQGFCFRFYRLVFGVLGIFPSIVVLSGTSVCKRDLVDEWDVGERLTVCHSCLRHG